jgi:hypothetical protein
MPTTHTNQDKYNIPYKPALEWCIKKNPGVNVNPRESIFYSAVTVTDGTYPSLQYCWLVVYLCLCVCVFVHINDVLTKG